MNNKIMFREAEKIIMQLTRDKPQKDAYKFLYNVDFWKPYFLDVPLIDKFLEQGPISVITYYHNFDLVYPDIIDPYIKDYDGYMFDKKHKIDSEYLINKGYKKVNTDLPWIIYFYKK